MTTDNPLLDYYAANASVTIGGDPSPNHLSLTYLWNGMKDGKPVDFYAAGAHEEQNGFQLQRIYLGKDYQNDSNPINILSANFSATSDLVILTAEPAPHPARDPNSRLVGVAVALQVSQGGQGPGTIYTMLASPDNVALIDQVTGSSITADQILAGNSILGIPLSGDEIWSRGVGAWGNFGGGANDPDGFSGQWHAPMLAVPPTLGDYTDPISYRITEARAGGDALTGVGFTNDSGSPGVIRVAAVPEPLPAGMTVSGLAAIWLRARKRCREPFA